MERRRLEAVDRASRGRAEREWWIGRLGAQQRRRRTRTSGPPPVFTRTLHACRLQRLGYKSAHTRTHARTHMRTHMHVHEHTCIRTYTCAHTRTRARAHTHTHTHTCAHTRARAHAHTNEHTCARTLTGSPAGRSRAGAPPAPAPAPAPCVCVRVCVCASRPCTCACSREEYRPVSLHVTLHSIRQPTQLTNQLTPPSGRRQTRPWLAGPGAKSTRLPPCTSTRLQISSAADRVRL
jgi:hypothetical protein